MNLKIKIYLTALVLVFILNSCDNPFVVDDKEFINKDLVVSNESYIVGLWANLYHSFNNGFQEVGSSMLASACDEADSNVPFGPTNAFNQGSWNSYNNPYSKAWAYMYSVLNNASYFLEVSDTTLNKDMVFYKDYIKFPDNKLKYNTFLANLKGWRADARFFKAYHHFQLWKMYGNVPIVDKVLSKDEALKLKQATTQEVVNYIDTTLNRVIKELDELERMPNTIYTGGKWNSNNLGRITKGAAFALKCRMYLYAASPLYNNGTYNKAYCDSAARAAAKIINMNIYSLNISYSAMQFDRSLANPENILDYRSGVGNLNYFELQNYPKGGEAQYVNVDNICSNATCPSQNLVDAYEKLPGYTSTLPFQNLDARFKLTILCDGDVANGKEVESYKGGVAGIGDKNATTTGYYLKKFVVDKVTLPVGTQPAHIWYVFRYGEVLLNYAEAMFNAYGETTKKGYVTNGPDMSALDAINKTRLRTGLTGNIAIVSPLNNEKIQKERQVELAFEGHRFWDVRRWKIAEISENAPLRGMFIVKNSDNTKTYNPRYEVEKRLFTAGMEHFPIPYTEMNQYPSWTQNWW